MKEWEQFLAQLGRELGPFVVQEWVPKMVRFDAGNVYLGECDSFQTSWFEEHVRPRLKGFVNHNQRPIKVHLGEKKKGEPKKESPRILSFAPDPLDPEMTLENFIPTQKNLVAHKVLTELNGFNPIYLYGPKGVGKTHLLMGAASALQKMGKRVFFVRSETFTGHVVQAIRLGQMQAFRRVYRDIDALIIDDIDLFSRKAATQEEFFHTFNTLHTMGRPILLSANTAPAQLSEIEPRLISRFEWGISLGLERGDMGPILEKKGALWNMPLDEELKRFLLEKFPQNPILALQALVLRGKGAPMNIGIAEKLLKDLFAKEQENALTPEKIIKAVAGHYGITSDDLLGSSQMREYALPRQMAMYLCRDRLKMPFQAIGRLFDRDHSTVMGSVKQIQKAIEEKKMEPIGSIH